MADTQRPGSTLLRGVLLVAVLGAGLFNGLLSSPLFDPVLFLLRPFVRPVLTSPLALFYFTSLFIWIMTVLLAGVPAAVYERIRGHPQSTSVSVGIWLAATLVLALPGILGAAGYFELE